MFEMIAFSLISLFLCGYFYLAQAVAGNGRFLCFLLGGERCL